MSDFVSYDNLRLLCMSIAQPLSVIFDLSYDLSSERLQLLRISNHRTIIINSPLSSITFSDSAKATRIVKIRLSSTNNWHSFQKLKQTKNQYLHRTKQF